MLRVKYHKSFKKDYKQALKRNYDISLLEEVISVLVSEKELAPKYNDHKLSGKYKGFRECHILPDWLLIYKVDKKDLILVLSRTGKHNDLFE